MDNRKCKFVYWVSMSRPLPPKRHSIALWPTERSNYPNIHFFPSGHWGKQKIIKMFSSLCAIFARMRVTDGTKKVTDRTGKVTDRTPHRL